MDDELRQTDPILDLAPTPAKSPERLVEESCLSIETDLDIVVARQKGRALAAHLGFSSSELTLIATVISELARNIVLYAKRGEVVLKLVDQIDRQGIVVVARDEGPGILDLRRALQGGYSTSRSLGLGLSGVKRLMDEFEIVSEIGRGTTVKAKKWKK